MVIKSRADARTLTDILICVDRERLKEANGSDANNGAVGGLNLDEKDFLGVKESVRGFSIRQPRVCNYTKRTCVCAHVSKLPCQRTNNSLHDRRHTFGSV